MLKLFSDMSAAVKEFTCTDDEVYLKKLGYSIGTTIGEGSYAKVKSAYSEKLQKRVAMKIINRRKAPKDFKEKFLPRELKVLKVVNHPNVIKLYEIVEFEHKVCFLGGKQTTDHSNIIKPNNACVLFFMVHIKTFLCVSTGK